MLKVRHAASLALVLGLAAGAAAADPAPPPIPVPPAPKPVDPPSPLAVQGDTKVPPYRLVKLKAVNVPDKAGLLWKIRPQDPKTAATAIDWASAHNKTDLRFVAPPGTYLVELSVAGPAADGSFTLDGTEVTVEIQSPTPVDPPPAPTPGPTPPAPAGNGAWVIVVADEANPTPAQAKVLDGPALRALKAAGKCRVYGSRTDADKLAAKKYDALMAEAKVPAPALLVLDRAGGKVLAVALPADEAGLAAALKGVVSP